jgi:hypothetical protein
MTMPALLIELGLPVLPFPDLSTGIERYKMTALTIMYQLTDCTAFYKAKCLSRAKHQQFLETLDKAELAILGTFIKLLALRYSSLSKFESLKDAWEPNSQSTHNSSGQARSDADIRERNYVFEDQALRCGPFFVFSMLLRRDKELQWAEEMMEDGLKNMNAFERGELSAHASLQSIVWKVFCEKANCHRLNSWDMAIDLLVEVFKVKRP